jgi:hypothetical protein
VSFNQELKEVGTDGKRKITVQGIPAIQSNIKK